MPHQVALTICATVRPERLADLHAVVDGMGRDGSRRPLVPFAALPETHFARLVVLDGTGPDVPRSAGLVLTLDCDSPARRRLRELVRLSGAGLDELFGHCVGYPSTPTPRRRLAYLRARLRTSEVFYMHAVGRTLTTIRDEARLREAVEEWVDHHADDLAGLSPERVRAALREYVAADPSLRWALHPAARPDRLFRIREGVHRIAVPVLLLVAAPVLVPGLLLWLLALRRHEKLDPAPAMPLDQPRMRALGDLEDYGVQNAFTSIAPVKPGRFWRLSSAMSLLVANYTSRHVFTRGSLSGLTTVHFARFMRFGPEHAMLFTSYYDGSLESYNNDFVDQVAWVLNTVFGTEEGYPRTRWLVRGGAHSEGGFKAFIRGHQVPTPVWFSAYPDLAAVTIDQNSRFRAGLAGDLDGQEVTAWLGIL